MKKIILLVITLTIMNIIATAQTVWTQKTSMPDEGRQNAIGCSINGNGYVGLGVNYSGTYLNDFWEYNPSTNTWTKKADYPGTGSCAATAFAISGKIYVCLGFSSTGVFQYDLWEYNPANNTWTKKADFPGTPRYNAKSFVIGDSVYIATGSYNVSTSYLYDLWLYTPSNNTWIQKADFAGGKRSGAIAFSLGNKGYLGNGISIGGSNPVKEKDFWEYNPITDTWTSIADYPGYRVGAISFVINNTAYVGTGYDYSVCYNDFWYYDPANNIWQQAPTPVGATPRYADISFSINNIGYFGTGKTQTNDLPDLWAYNPTVNIIEQKADNSFSIFPNPAAGYLTIETPQQALIEILNIQGQLIKTLTSSSNKTTIDISGFTNGMYFLKVKTEKEVAVKKFVKE